MSFAPPRPLVASRAPAPVTEPATWAKRRPWRLVIGPGETAGGPEPMSAGTPVLVRTRYLGSWTDGFEVAEVLPDGYRLRRLSDGTVLAQLVSPDDVRPGNDVGRS